jgi:hypothetical protein
MQFIMMSEALLAVLQPDLFAQQRPLRILLAFGSAVARPKEVYELRFTAESGRGSAAIPARECRSTGSCLPGVCESVAIPACNPLHVCMQGTCRR